MKTFIKHISAFVVIFLLATNLLQSAVVKGTVIATADGLVRVEELCVGTHILGFDATTKSTKQVPVIVLNRRMTNRVFLINIDQEVIIAAADQQLYDPVANTWIAASNITTDNYLMNGKGNHVKCFCVIVCNADEKIFTVYDISTTEPHNFYATDAQVLTHNAVPLGIGIAFVFGETLKSIAFSKIIAGIGAFFLGIGTGGVAISLAKPGTDICFKDTLSRKDKKDHILQGKHNWSNLVPDPNNNWDKIVEIITAVMATGVHRLEEKTPDVYIAAATVCNRVVEVTYFLRDGAKIISDAWVK